MKQKVKIGTTLVFACFLVYLILQFTKVFVYYDDFGYLSLSYGNTVPDVVGSQFNLIQLIEFMGKHYLYSNGRLLYLFLFPFVYMMGGLTGVQVFMALSVLAVLVLAWYLAYVHCPQKGWGAAAMAVFICLLYGSIGIMIQRLGTYWYAASFLYVVPAIPFLLLSFCYYDTIDREPGGIRKAVCIVLAVLTCFSQEEWLVAGIALVLMILGYKKWKKKPIKAYDWGVLAASVTASLPILTSPAVRMRMDNNSQFASLSFGEKIITNVETILNLFFSADNRNYLSLLLVMLFVMALYMAVRGKKLKALNWFYVIFTVITGVYLYLKVYKFVWGQGGYSTPMLWMLSIYLIVTATQIYRLLYQENGLLMGMVFTCSLLTLACLVVVPEIPPRVMLPFMDLSFRLSAWLFSLIALNSRFPVIFGAVEVAAAVLIGVPNMRNIYRGYSANYQIHRINDRLIRENVQRIRQGEEISSISLYQNVDPLCSCEMVYNENFSYMIYWMDEYYDLPDTVELNYEPVTDFPKLIQEYK